MMSPRIKSGKIAPTDSLAGITKANKPTGMVAAAGTEDLASPITNTANAAITNPTRFRSKGRFKFKLIPQDAQVLLVRFDQLILHISCLFLSRKEQRIHLLLNMVGYLLQ